MNIDWSKAPEGATHYKPAVRMFLRVEDGYAHFFGIDGRWNRTDSHISQYPQGILIEREWTGAGLPPVGTVCEVQADHIQDGYWTEVEILAHAKHDEDDALLVCQLENGSRADMDGVIYAPERFRPIRTKEQIEAEEREKAVSAMYLMFYDRADTGKEAMYRLYDAGYRKQPKEDA